MSHFAVRVNARDHARLVHGHRIHVRLAADAPEYLAVHSFLSPHDVVVARVVGRAEEAPDYARLERVDDRVFFKWLLAEARHYADRQRWTSPLPWHTPEYQLDEVW